MDAVAGLLDGPRAREAFLLRSALDPPWALRIEDGAPLTVVAVVRGSAHLLHDTAGDTVLRGGDVAVLRGPDHYTVADDPATPLQVAIGPQEACRPLTDAGRAVVERFPLGVRTWGNSDTGQTVLLTGSYLLEGAVSRRLLTALPAVLVLRDDEWDCPGVPLLPDHI